MVKIIKLKGKTRMGKQKIKHHGDSWHLLSTNPLGLTIKSMKANVERLIQTPSDEHFEVVEEVEFSEGS